MAVVLEYTAPADLPAAFDLSQLHDELRAAGLAPERVESRVVVVPDPAPPPPPAMPDDALVPTVFLTFPDGQAQGPVDAVVAAHVPRVRYDAPALLAQRAGALAANRRAALLVRAAEATTVDEVRDALVAHLREGEAT